MSRWFYPLNILITKDNKIKLIDWEYAGKSHPLIDIAQFCVDSKYDIKKVNSILKIYYGRKPTEQEKNILYIFIASLGLLWTYWCKFKEEFSEFYDDYYKIYYSSTKKFIRRIKRV